MASVTGFTAARMLAIENASIVDGDISGDNLILTKHDGSTVNAGNVRGPAGTDGTDAAPGSVTVVADTTIVRTSDGRGKVATPTATEDATTKGYVDGLNSSRVSDIAALDTRLDVIEAQHNVIREGKTLKTTDGTLSASEVNVCSFTIPNPINGADYRVTFHGNFIASASLEGRVRVKHGLSAVTGGTQIAEACINHPDTRAIGTSIVIEFTYTGTNGANPYNVVVTCVPLANTYRYSANSTRPAVLIVDRIT